MAGGKEFGNESSEMKTKTKKLMLRDVAQGPSKSRRIKNVDGFFFYQSNAHAQAEGPRNRGFP